MPSVPLLSSLQALASVPASPLGVLLRASAGARASSAAPVPAVWAVLAHPQRWVEFDPSLRSVEPSSAEAGDEPDTWEVAAGEQVLGQMRLWGWQIPVDIEHVVDRSSLATTAHLFHGLDEEVEHLLIPQASGGTLVTARITLHGPLAVPAIVPRWIFRSLAVRLLARTAESGLRGRVAEIPSVA
ncbi:MAG TPA: SRPBCC family protein [Frankiaceae bacterium]|nr:SRPBCC family protein [Frankiaceae bacterium]